MSVTRAVLVERLALSADISIRDAEQVLSTVLDAIGAGLAAGHRIELRGFGVFERRDRDARQVRNPRTGESVSVDAKSSIHFKCGQAMHLLLNGDADARDALQAKRDSALRRRDEKAGQLTLL